MDKFSIGEQFRLELHWEKAIYEQDGICKLQKVYFSGPVLSNAQRIAENDYILLDFFEQYFIVAKNVYVAKLSWGEVDYNADGRVYLSNVYISHNTELNRVPKLNSNDYLIIDTANHQVEYHSFNMVYKTYVVNCDTNLYNFGGK